MLLLLMVLACDRSTEDAVTLDLPAERVDADRDGYPSVATGGNDCDDLDAAVHPGAEDLTCDGIDNDCYRGDGPDVDGDLSTVCAGDCADTDPDRSPQHPELCDQRDQDCDGAIDEGFDQDGDGAPGCLPLSGPVVTIIGEEAGSLQFGELLAVDLDGGGDELLLAELQYLAPPRVRVFRSAVGSLLGELEVVPVGDLSIEGLREAPDLDGDGHPEVFFIGGGYTDQSIETLSAWRALPAGGLEPWWTWDRSAANMAAAGLGDGAALLLAQDADGAILERLDPAGLSPVSLLDVGPGWATELWPAGGSVLLGEPGQEGPLELLSGTTLQTQWTWSSTEWRRVLEVATGEDVDRDGAPDIAWVSLRRDGAARRVFVALGLPAAPEVQEIELGDTNLGAWPVLLGGPDPLVLVLEHNLSEVKPTQEQQIVRRVLRAWRVAAGQAPELVQELELDVLAFAFEVYVTVGDLDGDGWEELIVADAGPPDEDGEFPGRLRAWSTFHDCDDGDPAVQRGCRAR